MAGWETKYTELKNINGGNKYTTDSQLTIDMFIVPIENAEYAVQKSLNAESTANSAKNKVDSLAKVASSGLYSDLLNKPTLFDGNYNSLSNKPTSLPASDVYSWAKASVKPTYTKEEVGLGNVLNVASYSQTEVDNKLNNKQDKITSSNKLDYGLIGNAPTVATKLSSLTNDIDNMYMRDKDWVTATNNRLPSSGLYLIQVDNSSSFQTTVNLGLVFFNGNYDTHIGFFHYYDEYYRVTLRSNGTMILEKYQDEYFEVARTNFYYIRLS